MLDILLSPGSILETAGTGTDGRASQGEDGIVLDIKMSLDILYPDSNIYIF